MTKTWIARLASPVIALLLSSQAAQAAAPTTAQKLERLRAQFETTATQLRTARRAAGFSLLAVGAGSTAAGAVLLANSDKTAGTTSLDTDVYPVAVLAIGVTFVLVGGVLLLVHSPYESGWQDELAKADEKGPEERLAAYEGLLRGRAEREHSERQTVGVLSIVAGAALGTLYFVSEKTYSNEVYLALGGILLPSGIVALLMKGPHETLLDEYRTWSKGEPAQASAVTPSFGLIADSRGAGVGLSLSF